MAARNLTFVWEVGFPDWKNAWFIGFYFIKKNEFTEFLIRLFALLSPLLKCVERLLLLLAAEYNARVLNLVQAPMLEKLTALSELSLR